MSGKRPSKPPSNPQPSHSEAGGDPSMEDILASIRRILSEDETPAPSEPPPKAQPPASDVLTLDPSMLVEEPAPPPPPPSPDQPSPDQPGHEEVLPMPGPERLPSLHAERPIEPAPHTASPEDRIDMPDPSEHPSEQPAAAASHQASPLVAPEAAAAAASSVGSLLRTIGNRQGVAVSRGGPTIEDLVREELRPVLKAWLDANLPPMVERLVRAEIERVVGRVDL